MKPEEREIYVTGVLDARVRAGVLPPYGYPPSPLPGVRTESRYIETVFFAAGKSNNGGVQG